VPAALLEQWVDMSATDITKTGKISPNVSIVIPAHNESDGIIKSIRTIEKVLADANVTCEIIIVDDGSVDDTFHQVQRMAADNRGLKGVQLSRNFGKESAILAGLEAAGGDAVITIDADLQHPPALIPEMLELWRSGYKVVHAVKRDRSTDSRIARWRAHVFNGLMTRLGGIDVRNSSDFKLLDRMVVDALVNDLPERRRFYRGLADWVGFRQTSVLFDVAERESGEGKWSFIALADLAMTAIVSFTSTPLRIVTFLGFLTLVFGLVITFDALWSWSHGRSVSGFATIIITLLIIGSFIMISLGIIGEYIAKMYEEIKRRPVYIVSSSCGFEADRQPHDTSSANG
jgi:glycosyltransferase involved in cell wall biosynthesis